VSILFDSFSTLPHAQSLNLNFIPDLGDAFVATVLQKLRTGSEWRLQSLLLAYSDLTKAGLKDLASLLRLTSEHLKYILVSGGHSRFRRACAFQQV
jgi:hypothetical protein